MVCDLYVTVSLALYVDDEKLSKRWQKDITK